MNGWQQMFLALAGVSGGVAVATAAVEVARGLGPAPSCTLEAYRQGGEVTSRPAESNINIQLGLLKPSYARWLQALTLVPGLVMIALGNPPIPSAGISALAFILLDEYLKGKPRRVRAQIEQELPPFLSRLSGALAVTDAVRKALDDCVGSIPEGSPLGTWLAYFLRGVSTEGAGYYRTARAEAERISPMLAIVVFQLSRLSETGGSGFGDSFTILAEELGARQEARAVAGAKAGAARQAVLMMLGIMAAIMVLLMSSAGMRQTFSQPIAEITGLICFTVMGFGYIYLNGMIAEALE
jgi:hypothetical protein